eukprot:TRINITY_DN543_c2_g1_i1.p1 TRINITY_DN543_c2_g1~~TRINITY_DN543_c2_g1_i1.p1  ORF type:complete len:486 (-),score=166.23 TRINITY_DN543_c2_g1_i1:101-1558(-)
MIELFLFCFKSLIVFIILLYTIDYLFVRNTLKKLPGPYKLPVFINFFEILKNHSRMHDWFVECTKKHGLSWTGGFPGNGFSLITADLECVEYILKTNFENYEKGPRIREIGKDLFGDGIFNVDGQLWKTQRQTASHMFKVRTLKEMVLVFNKHANLLINKYEEISKNSTKSIIDIQDFFHRFTLDSIGEIAFGININSLEKNVDFSKAFDLAQELTEHRFYSPFWRWMPSERKLKQAIKILNKFSLEIISQRKKDTNLNDRNDLLSRFMLMRDENDQPYNDEYLRDLVLNFIIAGRDTTAQLLTWTCYMLSQHPNVKHKLIEEINEKIGNQIPDYENTKDLKYTKAVLDEILRLFPPVPADPKMSIKDDTLPNGFFVPKGTLVIWSAYVLGRLPQYWGEDVDQFNPERWLDPERAQKIKPYQFIPFQAGPRICLGQNMAYLEAKILLCHLLRKIKFELVPNQKITYKKAITMPALNGIKMFIDLI